MKKLLISFIFSLGFSALIAQPTDRPLHNFYVNSDVKSLEFQYIFDSPQDSIPALKKKLKALLTSSQSFSNITYDSNFCMGNISRIFPSYYNSSKELKGNFKIDIKNGKYRVTVDAMTLNGSVFNDDLSDVVLTHNYAMWAAMAYNLLPDLNGTFLKLFTINPDSGGW